MRLVVGVLIAMGGCRGDDVVRSDANGVTGGAGYVWYRQHDGRGTAEAQFITTDSCSFEELGPCVVRACPGPPTLLSAGMITIDTMPPVTLSPEPDDAYPATDGPAQFASVSASGGDVPSFTITPGLTPTIATALSKPVPNAQIVIARQQDLALQWFGGGVGVYMEVRLESGDTRVTCRFSQGSNTGDGTIGADVLARLPAGEGSVPCGGDDVLLAELLGLVDRARRVS